MFNTNVFQSHPLDPLATDVVTYIDRRDTHVTDLPVYRLNSDILWVNLNRFQGTNVLPAKGGTVVFSEDEKYQVLDVLFESGGYAMSPSAQLLITPV